MTPRDFERYVGTPWLDGGRTLAGADCWGLFWLVYKEVLGIELPSYSESYATALDRAVVNGLIAGGKEQWRPVEDPEPGDGVLMMIIRRPHIGIVVGAGRLLHIEKGYGAVIESYRSLRVQNFIEDFYRYSPEGAP
jgi:cell wall-associated NlpC family hydrolase